MNLMSEFAFRFFKVSELFYTMTQAQVKKSFLLRKTKNTQELYKQSVRIKFNHLYSRVGALMINVLEKPIDFKKVFVD